MSLRESNGLFIVVESWLNRAATGEAWGQILSVAVYAGKRTIFDVLDEQQITWKVHQDCKSGLVPSLTRALRPADLPANFATRPESG